MWSIPGTPMPEPGVYPGIGGGEYRPDPYAPEYEMPRRYVAMGGMDCEFEGRLVDETNEGAVTNDH